MVTAPVSAPAQIARAVAPMRKQAVPTRQRASIAVLIVGTVLSLGSLAGPDWVLRTGVIVALASAVVSCGLAWRELFLIKRKHAQDLIAVARRHSEDLRAERHHNAEVLDTVSGRAKRWRHEVDRQQTQIAGLRVEVTALRSDLASSRRQLVRAEGVIGGLRETVRERDIEIALVRSSPGAESELHALSGVDQSGTAVPVGVEGRPLHDVRIEVPAMPNFEADRRSA